MSMDTVLGAALLILSATLSSGQNDGVRVVFDAVTPDTYTVLESAGELSICMRVEGTIRQEFSITLSSSGITASGGGVDFEDLNAMQTFTPFSTLTRCATITIINDDILESDEFFSIRVSSNDSSVNHSAFVSVTITNDDTVVIEFSQPTFTGTEGSPVSVCVAIVNGSIARSVSFSITPNGGSASGVQDYIPLILDGTFTTTNSEICPNLPLISDNIVEGIETVLLTVSSIDSPTHNATVNIMDDDGVVLQLSNTQLSVTEGNNGTTSLSVCVLLTNVLDGLNRDVPLLLSTSPSSASTSDFVPLTRQTVIIPMATNLNTSVCFPLEVTGDTVCEPDELFSVSIDVGNSLDMVSGSNIESVTILDDGDTIEDCGSLSVVGGSVEFSATIRGSMATYTCDQGYNLEGDGSRTCEATGTTCIGAWSGENPICRFADCGSLTDPENGAVMVSLTTFNSVATYSCDSGFTLNGATMRICQQNETWSADAPTCEIITCPSIESPANGELTLTSEFNFGSVARYSCNSGYSIMGTTLRICRITGSWTSEDPRCEPVDCLGLDDPANGMVVLTGTTFTNTANYSCSPGFSLQGDITRSCLDSGIWSGQEPTCVVDCGELPMVENGVISYSNEQFLNSVATITCSIGYIVTGDSTRTCMASGGWSGNQPTCQLVDCMGLSNPINGEAFFSSTTLGSVTSFSCDQGFALSSTEDRVCQSTGVWSGESPTCDRVDCGSLDNPTSGSVSLEPGTEFGSVATYSCNTGYELSGVANRTCQQSGEWSGVEPICIMVDCGPPSALNNGGTITIGLTTVGSLAVYACASGYELSVSLDIRTCMENGFWSGPDPTCDPVDCGDLASPQNGQVMFDPSTTFMSTAIYSCNLGYDLDGISSRECEEDGDWSMRTIPGPDCQPVECGSLTSPDNGNVMVTTTTFESEAIYSCNHGYELMGVTMRTCLANRTWSENEPICEPVDCGELSSPDNGEVDVTEGTRLNAVATYSCLLGYRLDGVEERTCGPDGQWSDSAPACVVVTCPDDRVDPINGFIDLMTMGLRFGSIVTYRCDPSFVLMGSSSQTCGPDGEWTGQPPTCGVLHCPARDDPVNGSSSILTSNVVVFNCDEGFTISNSILAISQCNPSTGMWSGDVPSCIIDDCGPPPAIVRGSVNYSTTVYLSRADYSCDPGFRVQPPSSAVRVCEAGGLGEWSGVNGACQPVDCGPLSDPSNGQVALNSTLRASDANYSCSDNYTLVGATRRVCQDDGSWSGEEPVCEDTDECALDIDVCEQVCVNTEGGYQCSCMDGYTLTGFFDCEDIDECSSNNGGCAQVCINTEGSRDCDCVSGFMLNQDGFNCDDIDECLLSVDNCSSRASCSNTVGRFNCSCLPGFQGDGVNCVDVDECALGQDMCSQFANCSNTEGGYNCSCLGGFSGDGQFCLNINECAEDDFSCAENGQCIDTLGSYICTCAVGFIGDGFNNCTDVNECQSNICHEFANCTNTIGNFSCSCDQGFSGDGVTCTNINECEDGTHDCHANAECTDTVGSFNCSCREGFRGNGLNCTDRCVRLFQIVLGGVRNCELWIQLATNDKLSDTASQVATEVQGLCTTCSISHSQIRNGEFSCLTPDNEDQVTYRAELLGNTDSDCGDLIDEIEAWVRLTQAPISVQGDPLSITSNCEVGVDEFRSNLECTPDPPVTIPVLTSESVSVPLIAGVAVAVFALIVILVVVIVVFSLIARVKRKRKSVEIPSHFVDLPTSNSYIAHPSNQIPFTLSTLESSAHNPLVPQTSLTDFGLNQNLKDSTFNPEGDVIPMLGRSYSTLSRNRVKPFLVQNGTTDDTFYDGVYDDKVAALGTTVVDTEINQTGPELVEIYDTNVETSPDDIYDEVDKEDLMTSENFNSQLSGNEIYDQVADDDLEKSRDTTLQHNGDDIYEEVPDEKLEGPTDSDADSFDSFESTEFDSPGYRKSDMKLNISF